VLDFVATAAGACRLQLRGRSEAFMSAGDGASECMSSGFPRGLTFELSWHQRRGALDSKRKMGRRPSA